MRVVDLNPQFWILLEDAGALYLDVTWPQGHTTFDFAMPLTSDEAEEYRRGGRTYINELARAVAKSNAGQSSDSPFGGRTLPADYKKMLSVTMEAWWRARGR